MRKINFSLLSFTILGSIITNTISCSGSNVNLDKLVGTDVKKSDNIIDDSITNELGITNFYALGDSLSDTGAALDAFPRKLVTMLRYALSNDATKSVIDNIKKMVYTEIASSGMSESAFDAVFDLLLQKINNIDLKINFLQGKAGSEVVHNYCTDGETAVSYLAQQLHETDFNFAYSANVCGQEISHYGKNYAVAGATAADLDGAKGLILNDFSLKNQARALISQHNIHDHDLVWVMIGGNDLFSILGGADESHIMENSISNIKTTLLTLMNNGFKHIILANSPDVSIIPSYINSDQFDYAHEISMEFNQNEADLVESLSKEYPGIISTYDLNANFHIYLNKFTNMGVNNPEGIIYNSTDPSMVNTVDTDSLIKQMLLALLGENSGTITVNIKMDYPEETKPKTKYLFWDTIHPRKWLHKEVSKTFYQLASKIFSS